MDISELHSIIRTIGLERKKPGMHGDQLFNRRILFFDGSWSKMNKETPSSLLSSKMMLKKYLLLT